MHRFVSQTVNKLDTKGRVSVPAQFRQVLAAQQTDGFYCEKAVGDPALNGFGEAGFADADERLRQFNPLLSKKYKTQATAIFARARLLSFDDEGRVRLPDDLIAYADISDRVLFVGLDRIFEIWNPDAYPAAEAARLEEALRLYEAGEPT